MVKKFARRRTSIVHQDDPRAPVLLIFNSEDRWATSEYVAYLAWHTTIPFTLTQAQTPYDALGEAIG